MERLTYHSPLGAPVSKGACKGVRCNCDCDACSIYKIISRLAAYEDTGMTPEEITTMAAKLRQIEEGQA